MIRKARLIFILVIVETFVRNDLDYRKRLVVNDAYRDLAASDERFDQDFLLILSEPQTVILH